MSETDKSLKFIEKQKEIHGRYLYIEKVIRPDKTGEPDIFAIYKGMPVYAESKLMNEISCTNLYPFKEKQLDTLERRFYAGAMSIGLLFLRNEVKYIMYDKLKPKITKEDWDTAEVFDWQTLLLQWMKNIQTNF
jgi:hypothetical protein